MHADEWVIRLVALDRDGPGEQSVANLFDLLVREHDERVCYLIWYIVLQQRRRQRLRRITVEDT